MKIKTSRKQSARCEKLVGYLLRGDPTYITSHDDARTKLRRFERYELIEELVVKYLEKNTK